MTSHFWSKKRQKRILSVIGNKVTTLVKQVFLIIQQFTLYSHHQVRRVKQQQQYYAVGCMFRYLHCNNIVHLPHINKNTPQKHNMYVLHHSGKFVETLVRFSSISSFVIWWYTLNCRDIFYLFFRRFLIWVHIVCTTLPAMYLFLYNNTAILYILRYNNCVRH